MAISPLEKMQSKFRGTTGLGSASSEEIGALATASGLPVPPTSPAAGAALGATPASAAMLGSSANQRSALRTAVQGSMSQATSERTGGAQVADRAAQEKKAAEAARLGSFAGKLDERVQRLVQDKVTAATTGGANAQTGLKIDKATLSTVPPESQARLEELLTKLGANQAGSPEIAEINALLGKTDIGSQLDANTLRSKFLTGSKQIGEALAAGLADSMKVSEADVSSLGVGSKEDIAALLGVDTPTLDNMSVSELLGDIRDEQQKQFTTTQNLQQNASSPLLGQAERQAARVALRGASASGVLSAEDSIKDIQDQLDTANTVRFAGEDVSIEKLLTDEYLSGVVKNYLDDPTSELSQDLAKSNPDLKEWIETNKAGLDKLAGNIDEDTAAFAALQYENQKLATPPDAGGQKLSEDSMKALIPDWGKLRGEAYVKPPLFDVLSNPSINNPNLKANIVQGINTLSAFDKSRVSELASMNYDNLLALGLDKKENMDRYISNAQSARAMETAPTTTPAAFLETLGVSSAGVGKFVKDTKTTRQMDALGLVDAGSTELLDILDPDGDGTLQPEDLGKAKVKFASMFKDKKLSDLLAAGQSTGSLPTITSLVDALKPKNNGGLPEDVYGRIQDSIADGDWEEGDAYNTFRNNRSVSYAKADDIYRRLQGSSKIGGYATKGIYNALTERATEDYENQLPGALRGPGYTEFGKQARAGSLLDPVASIQLMEAAQKLESQSPGTHFETTGRNRVVGSLRDIINQNAKNARNFMNEVATDPGKAQDWTKLKTAIAASSPGMYGGIPQMAAVEALATAMKEDPGFAKDVASLLTPASGVGQGKIVWSLLSNPNLRGTLGGTFRESVKGMVGAATSAAKSAGGRVSEETKKWIGG